MSDKIIQLKDEVIKKELSKMVRESIEKTLNELQDKEVRGQPMLSGKNGQRLDRHIRLVVTKGIC